MSFTIALPSFSLTFTQRQIRKFLKYLKEIIAGMSKRMWLIQKKEVYVVWWIRPSAKTRPPKDQSTRVTRGSWQVTRVTLWQPINGSRGDIISLYKPWQVEQCPGRQGQVRCVCVSASVYLEL